MPTHDIFQQTMLTRDILRHFSTKKDISSHITYNDIFRQIAPIHDISQQKTSFTENNVISQQITSFTTNNVISQRITSFYNHISRQITTYSILLQITTLTLMTIINI